MSGRNLDRMYQHIATRVEEMFQSEECDWDALNTLIVSARFVFAAFLFEARFLTWG